MSANAPTTATAMILEWGTGAIGCEKVMGVMKVRASQIMNGGRFHLGVLVGPAFEACEHVSTCAAEPCGLGHGTPSTYIQPNVTRPCASATVWGVCRTGLAAWVSTLGYDVLKPKGNEVVATEARACNLKLAHGGVGMEGRGWQYGNISVDAWPYYLFSRTFQPNRSVSA